MISTIGAAGFALAAAGFLVVAVVLVLGWRGRPMGLAPLLAVAASVVWGAGLALLHASDTLIAGLVASLDALRLAGWYGLLLCLIAGAAGPRLTRGLIVLATLVVGSEVLFAALSLLAPGSSRAWAGSVPAIAGIVGAVVGLALIEQVYRNAGLDGRWSLKYLCIGLSAVFAYDLFLFADAILLRQPDTGLWAARGYVNALVAPMVAVSAARNPDWSLDVYVSRRFVLHTASLMLAGGYLLIMAVAAWSIRAYGGAWGGPMQALFLVGSVLVLAVFAFSGQIRAKLRVFISKHFFNYRYDYREEWLRFSRTLTADGEASSLKGRVIQAVAQVMDSPGGALWQARETEFVPAAQWNLSVPSEARESGDSALVRFLAETQWVLILPEWNRDPARYRGIPMPEWLTSVERAWLLVPLTHDERLVGFVVLAQSRAGLVEPNWEDCDLLKIIGRQSASYLVQEQAAEALARAQQFETFHRLSAFVLHDLKNVIGQLSMLVRNARRHRDSPDFMADAIDTVEHAVSRMNQLMAQLRADSEGGTASAFSLQEALRDAAAVRSEVEPVPSLELPAQPIELQAERARFVAVIGNLIQNAQEATAAGGRVDVRASRGSNGVVVEVADTGIGMSREFIDERLFQPFFSSKGSSGMGIGAFEAREFARGLGGELRVSSTEGEGTRFRFELPSATLGEGASPMSGDIRG